MSDTPSISSAFRAGSDPTELRQAVVDLARGLDNSRTVDKVHWEHIKVLGEATERQDKAIDKLAETAQALTERMVRIETRIAIYAGLGAAVGAAIMAALMKLVFH